MILARNSRIPYYVIPQRLWRISIWNSSFVLYLRFLGLGGIFSLRNSRALVIASEAKQSLEILNSPLGILEFLEIASVALLPRNDAGNSKFSVMRS